MPRPDAKKAKCFISVLPEKKNRAGLMPAVGECGVFFKVLASQYFLQLIAKVLLSLVGTPAGWRESLSVGGKGEALDAFVLS